MSDLEMAPAVSPEQSPPVRRARARLPKLFYSPIGMIGASICVFWVMVSLAAPLLSPFGPTEQVTPFQFPGMIAPDGRVFLLGTDHLGRDILSRIIWGGRRVLFFSTLATGSAYIVGVSFGLIAGYFRGWIDDLVSSFANVVLSFPVLVLYVVIISTFGASGLNIIVAVTFASAPGIMRIVRGIVLDLSSRDYVASAQTRGESAGFIMFREILPNATSLLIVDACLRLGYTTITIGVLGFLGLGLPPPQPDWGGMINETRAMATFAPHMTVFPCIAISSFVLGLNLLADGLRETTLKD
jgi:peptide/nickel transport system permease protein